MNKAKLSALCAKARGYEERYGALYANGKFLFSRHYYNPIDDANQADDLLEYVTENDDWDVQRHVGGTGIITYDCTMDNGVGYSRDCKTQNLAKILCALRASDKVTDAEINDAMEEKP